MKNEMTEQKNVLHSHSYCLNSAKENSAVNNLFTSLIMAIEHGLPTSSSSSLLSSSSSSSSANKTANDHQTIDQTNNKHNKCIVS